MKHKSKFMFYFTSYILTRTLPLLFSNVKIWQNRFVLSTLLGSFLVLLDFEEGGKRWETMRNNEWYTKRNCEKQWKTTRNDEKQWETMRNDQKRWEAMRNDEKRWETMRNDEKRRETMRNDEKRWETMRSDEKRWETTRNDEKQWECQISHPSTLGF